jgi:hypothetical protein
MELFGRPLGLGSLSMFHELMGSHRFISLNLSLKISLNLSLSSLVLGLSVWVTEKRGKKNRKKKKRGNEKKGRKEKVWFSLSLFHSGRIEKKKNKEEAQ